MAIQKINLGTEPLGEGGDTYRSANTKINENFSNTAHAASRLVGVSDNDVPLVANLNDLTFSRAGAAKTSGSFDDLGFGVRQTHNLENGIPSTITKLPIGSTNTLTIKGASSSKIQFAMPFLAGQDGLFAMRAARYDGVWGPWALIYNTSNTTKDSNGFIKAASPVVDLYDDHIELNHDAERQGNISYKKLGTGDYLVEGSLGFAQEGWYIEMPKDANGNVLVAVVYEQLENNDISIKTYDYMLNKKGRIVPDTETPLDIPEGRCINLRLHEIREHLEDTSLETVSK